MTTSPSRLRNAKIILLYFLFETPNNKYPVNDNTQPKVSRLKHHPTQNMLFEVPHNKKHLFETLAYQKYPVLGNTQHKVYSLDTTHYKISCLRHNPTKKSCLKHYPTQNILFETKPNTNYFVCDTTQKKNILSLRLPSTKHHV